MRNIAINPIANASAPNGVELQPHPIGLTMSSGPPSVAVMPASRVEPASVELPASLIVLVRSEPVADYSAEAKSQLQEAALGGITSVYPEYQHLTTKEVLVDNLKALRLTGSVRRKSATIEVSTASVAVSLTTTVPKAKRSRSCKKSPTRH